MKEGTTKDSIMKEGAMKDSIVNGRATQVSVYVFSNPYITGLSPHPYTLYYF